MQATCWHAKASASTSSNSPQGFSAHRQNGAASRIGSTYPTGYVIKKGTITLPGATYKRGGMFSIKGARQEDTMQRVIETGITRRAAVAAAAVGGISLLVPKGALAAESETLDQNLIDHFVRPDLTENQFDAMLRERAEEEAAQIIEQALAGYDGDTRAGGRPTYDTVYGSVANKSTGWHDVAGQPPGGVQISGGGSIFVSPSGGGSSVCRCPFPEELAA